MWLLAVSLPLLPVIVVLVTHYRDALAAFCRNLVLHIAAFPWRMPKACVRSTHNFIFVTCTHGNPESVLEAFHLYARTHPALSLGPSKGEILDEVVRQVAPSRVLELGTHCGYSSVRILRLLPPGGRLLTVERDPVTAEAGEEVILVAGFKHSQFQLLTCPSADAIVHLRTHLGAGLLELVLMDHDVGQYLSDLQALEREELLAPGCVLLFNNAHPPAADTLLGYVGSRPERYAIRQQDHSLLELQCPLLAAPVPLQPS
ncbi:transmembrane O-methyltransferase homolog [Megalops cyprinoides]|uniref:transmembrane O-methyltransferase homolog n=1 Tax=Megalops cyprinoides TaxID=118141 RepID=UPI001863D9C9|nr:transmembrane O-methyltransferase homolog [Megalops cyprinoides]